MLADVIGTEKLAAWFRAQRAFEVAETLCEAGVPAYVVQCASDLHDDPQLKHAASS